MQSDISTKRIAKNVSLSIIAQVVSLFTSFALGFIVPKFISEHDYSYWQIYVLYVSYVGILHFGLLDGLVLRYSQYDYEELDKPRIRSQFQLMLVCVGTIAFVCCACSHIFIESISSTILILVAIGMVTKNVFTYTSYTFQITNRIGKYAVLVITQRGIYAIVVLFMLLMRAEEYYWYCIADLLGDIAGFIIGIKLNKDLYFGNVIKLKETLLEAKINIASGINLLIANFASSLIIGGAKMVIQWRWDALIFGKVAFSFSVTNLFLSFVTAISVVLFPSLKRTDKNRLPSLYVDIRNTVSPLLFIALMSYFPMSEILKIWLPQYTESLVYLGVLLPTIIFSSKVSLLTNNYLKAYRKERILLMINVGTVAFSFTASLFCAYIIRNLDLLLYFAVAAIMIRSIISEMAVSRLINIEIKKDFVVEFLMTLWFIIVVKRFDLLVGVILYFVAVVVYLYFYRSTLKNLLGLLKMVRTKN